MKLEGSKIRRIHLQQLYCDGAALSRDGIGAICILSWGTSCHYQKKDYSYSPHSCPRRGQAVKACADRMSPRGVIVFSPKRVGAGSKQSQRTHFSRWPVYMLLCAASPNRTRRSSFRQWANFVAAKAGDRKTETTKGRHMMWPHASCHQRRTFSPQNSTMCLSCLYSAPRRRQAVLLNTRRSPPIY